MTTTDTAYKTLQKAVDPWQPGATEHRVWLAREDAHEILSVLLTVATGKTRPPVALAFQTLGLDPADLGTDLDDGHAELYYHDGPLLVVEDYDEHDPDSIRAVAEWFDALAAQASQLADRLRDQAVGICDVCRGYGTVEVVDGDADCRACGGTGCAA